MRRFLPVVSLSLFAAAATACGPDPLLGTYSYTGTIATMFTQPATANSSDATTGTAVVTASTASGADYSVDFAAATSSQHCVLDATRNGSTGITFTPGQTCAFSGTYNNAPYQYTATITSGNGVLNGTSMMFTVNYTFQGNSGAIALVGSGTQALEGTRAAN